MPSNRRSFVAVQVTLTSANTNYNLLALVNAIIAAETGSPSTVAVGMGRSLILQSNPGIDGAGANTNDVLVGDGLLSTTRYGYVLAAVGGVFQDQSPINNVNLADIYVRSAGAGQKVNVQIVAG